MTHSASIGRQLALHLAAGGLKGRGLRWNWGGPEVAWVAEIESPRVGGRWALDLGADLPLRGAGRSGEWSIQLPAESIPGASADMIHALDGRAPMAEDSRAAVLAELADLVCDFVMSNGTVAELAGAFRRGALSSALMDAAVRAELTEISEQNADE